MKKEEEERRKKETTIVMCGDLSNSNKTRWF